MVTRKRINAPTGDERDVHYIDYCKFALEPSVSKLVDLAEDAGWSRQRVLYSLMFLAAEMAKTEAKDT